MRHVVFARQRGSVPLLVTGLAAAALAAGPWGCKPYPPAGYVIEDVEVLAPQIPGDEALLEQLATQESPKFLGFIPRLVFEYEVFDENVLERDLERIERFYRARGYYEAYVTATRVLVTDAHHVRVQIRVDPGLAVQTGRVTLLGIERLPLPVATAALAAVKVQPNRPFDESEFEESKQAVARALADRGYAFAKVRGQATVDVAEHRAEVRFEVSPGPVARFGAIQIIGLKEIPPEPVLDSIYIQRGDPYSLTEIEDAYAALVNLGVFATVEVRQDKTRPDTEQVPITFVVQEGSLRALRAGIGARIDPLKVSNHLRLGWQDRNFLGGMRDVLLEIRPSLTYFPLNSERLFQAIGGAPEQARVCCLLVGNEAMVEIKRPSFIEARTSGSLRGEYNIYPLLFTNMEPDDPVIRYDEFRASASLERAFFYHHLFVRPSFNFQLNQPGSYETEFKNELHRPDGTRVEQVHPSEYLDAVEVRYPELITALDWRDDVLDPRSGVYLGNSLQVAGHGLGGSVSDVRVQPEVRGYVPINRTKSVSLAARFTAGFLFPSGYGGAVPESAKLRCPQPGADGTGAGQRIEELDFDCPTDPDEFRRMRNDIVNDQHKMLFRGFYSGGATSNRGYGFREVGPHGPLGILTQSDVANCIDNPNVQECVRPLGGLSLWEAAIELRFPVFGEWRGAAFLDTSNVSLDRLDLDFSAPHASLGFGLRYLTPIGPFRFDIGYRVPGLQRSGDTAPNGIRDAAPLDGLLGIDWLPLALHINLGEAF